MYSKVWKYFSRGVYVWYYTKTRVDIFLPLGFASWHKYITPRFSVIPIHTVQGRSQGGGGSGGSYDPPPQLPIPKILFHPLAILFHPLAILFHLSAILFHPLAILFHPSAILFHPLAICSTLQQFCSTLGICGWRHTGNVQGGGGCECPRVGAFFKLMTSRGQCPRGGVRLVFHPSKFRPPPPTWLAGYGPDVVMYHITCGKKNMCYTCVGTYVCIVCMYVDVAYRSCTYSRP